jgi:hypothetical protein
MRRAILGLLASTLVLTAGVLGAGMATAKPKPPGATSSVTIGAAPNPVVFGSSTTIAGQVTGKKAGGATVDLQSTPYPYTATATNLRSTTADASGHYSFGGVAPTVSTLYRVVVHTAPAATSANLVVKVRVKIGLRLSTRTPAIGQRVRFTGLELPAYNGKFVQIQRKTPTGWKTLARAKLVAAAPVVTVFGLTSRSKYSKSLRIFRNGTYRVWFNPNDPARLGNSSPTRRMTVH